MMPTWAKLLLLLLLAAPAYADTLKGTLVDANGNAVAGALVTVCTTGSTGTPCAPVVTTSQTGSDGSYFITIATGTYDITFTRAGFTSQKLTNVLTGNPINFTVPGNGVYTGTITLTNNNFLNWFKNDGITTMPTIGIDSNNNTVFSNIIAGRGMFFKLGGVGVGDIGAPATGNFSGNVGWNNMIFNSATFGVNPASNSSAWNASQFRFGQTDATQNSNAFTNTFQILINGSATNTGNIEKGGAFFNCLDNDTTATTPVNCVGFDSLAEGPAANSNSAIWGGVMRTQIDSTGDGSSFGLEIDSTNNGTGNNNHGDVSKHKTGLWFAAFGSQPSSWMIDSAGSGTAWNNGIALRNITASGIGLELPNNIGLYWRNPANSADLKVLTIDGSGNSIWDTGSSGTGLFFRVNGSNVAIAQSTGWSSMTLSSPTINLLTNGTGLQVFNTTTTCTTGAAVGATCTTAAISLPVAEADTSYRITCTGKGPTAVPVISSIANSSATQFTITIAALTAVAASFSSYDCVAGHN